MRRRLLFATCLAALFVLQLNADNEEPPSITVSLDCPAAGLLGGKVQLKAIVSKTGQGGSGQYQYQWTLDEAHTFTVNYNPVEVTTSAEATPKQISVECTVTDTGDSSITATSPEAQLWQISITAANHQDTIESEDSQDFQVQVRPENAPCDAIAWRWEAAYTPNGYSPHVEFAQQNQESTHIQNAHWYAFPDHRLSANVHSYYNIYCDVTIAGVLFEQSVPTRWRVSVGHVVRGDRIVFGECEWPLVAGVPAVAESGGTWRVVGKGTMYRMYPQPRVYMPYPSDFRAKFQAHENYHNTQFISIEPWNTKFVVDTAYARVINLEAATEQALLNMIATEINDYNEACMRYVIPDNEAAFEQPAYAVSNNLEPDYLESDNYN